MDAARHEKCCGVYGWGTSLSSGLLESLLRFKIRAGGTTLALPGLHRGAVALSGPSTGTSPDEFTSADEPFVRDMYHILAQLASGGAVAQRFHLFRARREAWRRALRAALVFCFLVGPAGADAASAFDAREMPAPV